MWSRRSEAEIAAVQRKQKRWYSRFNPIPALGGAFAFASVILLCDLSGGRGFRAPLSFADAAARSPHYFIYSFAVIFCICVFGGRHVRRPSAVRTVICPRCRRTQTYFGEDFCVCGARFEPIDYWYWNDDDMLAPNA
jgi:hypothetical protein